MRSRLTGSNWITVAREKLTIIPLIYAASLTVSETLVTINRTEMGRCSFDLAILRYTP